jgi:hypothetical protein
VHIVLDEVLLMEPRPRLRRLREQVRNIVAPSSFERHQMIDLVLTS